MSQRLLSIYKGRRVFVTGGLGFIGSNLALALLRLGAKVTVADSHDRACGANEFNLAEAGARVKCIVADIGDPSRIESGLADSDVIFNLAGEISHTESIRNPRRDLDLNVCAQLAFLQACKKVAPRARVVYASSRQIYGTPRYVPVDEQHPVQPVDFNGVHKWAAENYHFLFSTLYGMNVTCLRLTNVYGPRQALLLPGQGFASVFFRLALVGKKITVFGDGRQLRDMLYVEDAVSAFLLAGAFGSQGINVYNVGGSQQLAIQEIARSIARASGGVTIEYVPFPENRKRIDIGSYYSDISKIRRELGWGPRIDFQSGVERTVAFYRRFGQHYLNDSVNPTSQFEATPRQLSAGMASTAN